MKTKIRLPVSLTTAISTRARAYHTLRTEVSLNGEALAVRTLVKEANAGKFHYDMSVPVSYTHLDVYKRQPLNTYANLEGVAKCATSTYDLRESDMDFRKWRKVSLIFR